MDAESNYINDILQSLIDSARDAKRSSLNNTNAKSVEQRSFDDGRALAYYEVVSTLINRAEVFGLSRDVIPALRFDADKELL